MSSDHFTPHYAYLEMEEIKHWSRSASSGSSKDPEYFNFRDIDITNIVKDSDEKYLINLFLFVDKVVSSDSQRQLLGYLTLSDTLFSKQMKLNVTLNYDRENKQIKILSAIEERGWNFDH